jgi:tRNA(fMet)-specific endonuclease VapC
MAGVRFLLDTNVLSEPVVARPNPAVLARFDAHGGAMAISSITWHEALYGMCKLPEGRRRGQIEHYLLKVVHPTLPILAFDELAAAWQAEERARLGGIGLSPAYVDSQIAAVAAVNNLVLVTRNAQDFRNFTDLRVENWFEDQ